MGEALEREITQFQPTSRRLNGDRGDPRAVTVSGLSDRTRDRRAEGRSLMEQKKRFARWAMDVESQDLQSGI